MAKYKGFTLLRLVVSLLITVIIYWVLSTRLVAKAESVERAAVHRMIGQLQQQITFMAAASYIKGSPSQFVTKVKENPFKWSADPPPVYAGEITENDGKERAAGRWYFDVTRRELMYRVQYNTHLKIKGASVKELRFMLNTNASSVYSVRIEPVQAFVWNIDTPFE